MTFIPGGVGGGGGGDGGALPGGCDGELVCHVRASSGRGGGRSTCCKSMPFKSNGNQAFETSSYVTASVRALQSWHGGFQMPVRVLLLAFEVCLDEEVTTHVGHQQSVPLPDSNAPQQNQANASLEQPHTQ